MIKEEKEYKLIKYEDGDFSLDVKVDYQNKTVWLTQKDMSLLFEVDKSRISRHIKNMLSENEHNESVVAINAGGFEDPDGRGNGGRPEGPVIKDGKLVWGNGNAMYGLAGFNNDNILVLTYTTPYKAIEDGMRDAITFGPFLVVNGVSATINGNGGWGINPRTVLAQRKDGIVLFLVIDGNGINRYNWSGRGGASLSDVITILERYGAYNAVNMDGGASTNLVINNELRNKPCAISETGERRLPNGWAFK